MSGVKIIPIGVPRTVRERLLEALGDVLAREGFASVTMEAVAVAAGVDRNVAFRHFRDLDAMVAAFGQSARFWPTIEELREDVADRFAAMPLRAQLIQYCKATIRGLLARPRTLDILAWELVARNHLTRFLEVPRVRLSLEFFEGISGERAESLDLSAVLAVLGGAAVFLAVRSRQSGVFGGLNLYDDADLSRVDRVVERLITGLLHEGAAG